MLFNKTETYYGKVDKSKSKVWLYSKDDRYLTTLNEITEWKKAKDGDILRNSILLFYFFHNIIWNIINFYRFNF